jgi:hypothetical protein
MTRIDPEQERQRLIESYQHLSDEELEQLAAQASELTTAAHEVLRAELAKRGLNPTLTENPPSSEPAVRDLVVVRRFRDLPEALLAKGSLDSAGIECALADDNMVRLDWFYSNAIGGIRLLVDREDLDTAEQLLNQPIPENFDVSGLGQYEQPRCPKCGSLDINFRESNPAAYLSLAVNVPIPFRRRAWRCHSCHAEWEIGDAPDTEQSPA